jgi:hypothetical protein
MHAYPGITGGLGISTDACDGALAHPFAFSASLVEADDARSVLRIHRAAQPPPTSESRLATGGSRECVRSITRSN